jgi:hypothetical protein
LILKLLPTHSQLNHEVSPLVSSGSNLVHRTGSIVSNRGNLTPASMVMAPARDGEDQAPAVNSHFVQIIQLFAMNFVSPFSAFNQVYFDLMRSQPTLFPENYVRNLENAAWNHEDTAGSPLHMGLVLLAIIIAVSNAIQAQFRHGVPFALVLVSSFILVSVIGSGTDIYVIRYQLGFFALGAPLAGVVLSGGKRFGILLTIVLLLYSIPYILFSNMRPVIGHTPWPTRVPSVFNAPKDELLFAINPGSRVNYERITNDITLSGCCKVGLYLYERNLEYQIWYLLKAPQSGIEIQHMISRPEFERYTDNLFIPCGFICTNCEEIPESLQITVDGDIEHPRFINHQH